MPQELKLPPSTVVGVIGNAVILADGRMYFLNVYNGITSPSIMAQEFPECVPGTEASEAVKKARGW